MQAPTVGRLESLSPLRIAGLDLPALFRPAFCAAGHLAALILARALAFITFLVMVPAIVFVPAPALAQPAREFTAGAIAKELVGHGSLWRYFRGWREPSGGTLDWTLPGFDDTSWEIGAAGFGYGDGDDATILTDMKDGYSTVYIRWTFDSADSGAIVALNFSIDYDDGYVAFLNGQQFLRANCGPSPAFDDLATDSHEAGIPEGHLHAFVAGPLLTGTNVLAIVGLNDSIGSSDFSLHPSCGGLSVLAEACEGDLYVRGGTVLIGGEAPETAAGVSVNGEPADYDPATGVWSYEAVVGEDWLDLVAEARDGAGNTLEARTLRAIPVRAVGGEVAEGETWGPGRPLLVVEPVWVPSGRVLTIEAGCEVLIQPGVGFIVQGAICAQGTAESPIRFTHVPCQANWGHFEFEAHSGPNTFSFCEWSHAVGDPGCLTLTDSDLELAGCAIRDIHGEGVHATGSRTRIRNCLTERTEEALSLDRGDTVVEFCTIRDSVGKSDLIDANGSWDPPARIAFNHIYGTTDDGIDVDTGSVVAEGNVIHDCGDQAISLVGQGESRVIGNICYRNGHGLSVKDSHVCVAEHNTFAFNSVTGVRAIEKTTGRGGGIVSILDSIVWGNVSQLVVESTGSIDVSYSDVEGAAPPGLGNISLDPLFVDPDAGDFHLTEGSPAIGVAADGGDQGALPFHSVSRVPRVFGIEPAEGAAAGGTDVVIHGSNFLGTVEVRLGGEILQWLSVVSSEEIRGVTPAGTPGPVDLTVSAEGGQATMAGAFTYIQILLRGDADGDGWRDISDAISVLAFLFQGGAAPPCPEAADASADGEVDLADAIFLLFFLFADGEAPDPAEAWCE